MLIRDSDSFDMTPQRRSSGHPTLIIGDLVYALNSTTYEYTNRHHIDAVKAREPLINSGRADLRVKITRFKARIASNSTAIAKIRNAEAGDFGLRAAGHELIRGSLNYRSISARPDQHP